MQFAPLVPELTVTDIEQTKAFYLEIIGFTLEYERPEDQFIFLSFEGSQFMSMPQNLPVVLQQNNTYWLGKDSPTQPISL